MLFRKKEEVIDFNARMNEVETVVYQSIKSYGFRKYGRTLHRFVSEDISQVINFQRGQSYRGETHLFAVNLGIRIPECAERAFQLSGERKKFYQEYECTLRARINEVRSSAECWYDLHNDPRIIAESIVTVLCHDVIPVFDILSSRTAILQRRREYPDFDTTNRHLILLEEALIYGHQANREQAQQCFSAYYQQQVNSCASAAKRHLEYLHGLAETLGLEIPSV